MISDFNLNAKLQFKNLNYKSRRSVAQKTLLKVGQAQRSSSFSNEFIRQEAVCYIRKHCVQDFLFPFD